MKKLILCFLFCPTLFSNNSFSQVSQEWAVRFDHSVDFAVSIATDKRGNIFVTGSSGSSSSEDDFLTIKYNSSGEQQWLVRYNGPGNFIDKPVKIVVDDFGNSYVTGGSWGIGSSCDIATVKYDSNGVELWAARYNGAFNLYDEASGISVDRHGNVFVTGYLSANTYETRHITLKYNSSGIMLWESSSSQRSAATDIEIDEHGNSYVTGIITYGTIGFYDDIFTVKFDSLGNTIWTNTYNGLGHDNDVSHALSLDSSCNVFVAGRSIGSQSKNDMVVIKYSTNGNEEWVVRFNSGVATCLTTDNYGNVIAAGYSGVGNLTTLKYNGDGIQQWVRHSAGSGIYSIAADESGNIYVTGYGIFTGIFYDYVTLKYDSDGMEKWLMRYSGEGDRNDRASELTLDNFGNIYVTGFSVNEFLNSDYLTIKYSNAVGINSQFNSVPTSFRLSQNYPNPFNPVTNLEFGISDWPALNNSSQVNQNSGGVFVSLKIYDVLGNEVATLVNENKLAGNYSVKWNATNYPSGVYFYRITAGDFSEVKKMTLLK